jgi:hypothetical protein
VTFNRASTRRCSVGQTRGRGSLLADPQDLAGWTLLRFRAESELDQESAEIVSPATIEKQAQMPTGNEGEDKPERRKPRTIQVTYSPTEWALVQGRVGTSAGFLPDEQGQLGKLPRRVGGHGARPRQRRIAAELNSAAPSLTLPRLACPAWPCRAERGISSRAYLLVPTLDGGVGGGLENRLQPGRRVSKWSPCSRAARLALRALIAQCIRTFLGTVVALTEYASMNPRSSLTRELEPRAISVVAEGSSVARPSANAPAPPASKATSTKTVERLLRAGLIRGRV